MTKAMPEFEVQARITVIASVSIVAKDLTEAIEKSKTMRETEFIKIKGGYLDGTHSIIGVSSKDGWQFDRD